MALKIHICATKKEANEAIAEWGEDKLISIGKQPVRGVQVFTGSDVESPMPGGDFAGLEKYVVIFNV